MASILHFPSLITTTTTTITLALATTALLLTLGLFTRGLGSEGGRRGLRIVPGPTKTLLPKLSREQASLLPYPPNLLPSARDVDTPYGTMRVYEWGPQAGRKVVLVHGDTIPGGPLFGELARGLVEKGCRVLVLDLWGRGYSDAPLDVAHDSRLFAMQILFAVTSSPLPWTGAGSNGFSIIGFSMGGGIVMKFIAHFPNLVNSIVLLAPTGILRRLPDDYNAFCFRHPALFSKAHLRRAVGRSCEVDLAGVSIKKIMAKNVSPNLDTGNIDVAAAVQWQYDFNDGFVPSLVKSIKDGPLVNQDSDWKKACNYIKGEDHEKAPSKLHGSKILVILGDVDTVVMGNEFSQGLERMFGPEHVQFVTVQGDHDFLVLDYKVVLKHICEFWKLDTLDEEE